MCRWFMREGCGLGRLRVWDEGWRLFNGCGRDKGCWLAWGVQMHGVACGNVEQTVQQGRPCVQAAQSRPLGDGLSG